MEDKIKYIQDNWKRLSESEKAILKTIGVEPNERRTNTKTSE